jgi:hypothetical protein
MPDDRPYMVHSATRITLSPTAREWAREWGMTDVEMAKHLLARHQLGNDVVPESDVRYGEEE